jgi:hypothetical protein
LADGLVNITATINSLRRDIQRQHQQQQQGPAVPDTPRNPEAKGKSEVLRRLTYYRKLQFFLESRTLLSTNLHEFTVCA